MTLFYVAIGGAIGSVMRFLTQNAIGNWLGKAFPYGTLLVNISGSFFMGVFVTLMAQFLPERSTDIRLFVAVGILGGYTTFSSFSLDAIALMDEKRLAAMAAYVSASVICSCAGLLCGRYLIRMFA